MEGRVIGGPPLRTRKGIAHRMARLLGEGSMRHLIQRLGFYLIALWASVTLNFLIPRLSPGSPVDALLARMHGRVSPAAIHALEIQYGVTKEPLFLQYLQYLGNLLH